jgi:hypothetical protein
MTRSDSLTAIQIANGIDTRIEDVRVYDRILTASEVHNLASGGAITPKLVIDSAYTNDE